MPSSPMLNMRLRAQSLRGYLRFAIGMFLLFCVIVHAATQQKPNPTPTIDVDARYTVSEASGDTPGYELTRTFFSWKSTGADYVLIVNRSITKAQTEGEIEANAGGGNYLFVAVGPNGSVARSLVAHVKSKRGPGRHGVIYDFAKDFNVNVFFQDAYKPTFSFSNPLKEVAETALASLQAMGYTVDTTREAAGPGVLLYTKNYQYSDTLQQSHSDRRARGKIERQIAFVVFISGSENESHRMYILPLVQRNFPRDNDRWEAEPDALELGRPAAELLAKRIISVLTHKEK